LLKLEGLNPTGSFKDRGAATAVTAAKAAGARVLVEDSSGNAGTAIAAYAAAAGLRARIFAPDSIVAAKANAIRALGADLVRVSGPRSAVTAAALAAAKEGFDAGHARDDSFLEGTKTIAYELFEQLGTDLHDIVMPVGQGTVLIGLAMGFADLVSAGQVSTPPRLHGAQSEACAPLVRGAPIGRPAPVVPQPSIADGIRIPEPTRAERSYNAVRYSGGRWIGLREETIERAWRDAARQGLLMEPTSAVALAAAEKMDLLPGAVVIITGSGLKAVDRY
jgi:threonine synthase